MAVTIGEIEVESPAPAAAAAPAAPAGAPKLDPDQLRRELRRIDDRLMRLWVD